MRKRLMFFLTAVTVLFLLGIQLFVSHKLSALGANLSTMDKKIKILNLENELLQREIATSSSLMTIAKKAFLLGFKNSTFLYLEEPPIALKK